MIKQELTIPASVRSHGTLIIGLSIVAVTYALELARSTHGWVFMHDVCNTVMGVAVIVFGARGFLQTITSQRKSRLLLGLRATEIVLGIILLFGITAGSATLSAICNVVLICLCATTLLYTTTTTVIKWFMVTMILMGFMMIGFYDSLHASVFSLTQFRLMQ